MQTFDSAWLPVLRHQEELLTFDDFSRDDAFAFGQAVIRLTRERGWGPVAMRVVLDEITVFSFKMEGTNLKNDWWMQKKENTVRRAGVSSLRALVEIGTGVRSHEAWHDNEGDYALCGGGFPLRARDGKFLGRVLVSGLPHQRDHQLLCDALACAKGVEIPSIEA